MAIKPLSELLADRVLECAELVESLVTVIAELHPVVIQHIAVLLALEVIRTVLVLHQSKDEALHPIVY